MGVNRRYIKLPILKRLATFFVGKHYKVLDNPTNNRQAAFS
jgi:hypothetical protein